MKGERVEVVADASVRAAVGRSGLRCHVPGGATTVSNAAACSGGIGRGNLVGRDRK